MKFYKNSEGLVFAFELDGSQDSLITQDLILMSDDEVFLHLNPTNSLSVIERSWRDTELCRADIQLNKVQDGVSGIGTVSAWRQYRTDLRNLPETVGFPETSIRPMAPDAL